MNTHKFILLLAVGTCFTVLMPKSVANDLKSQWTELMHQGQLLDNPGQYEKAADCYRKALSLAEKSSPDSKEVEISLIQLQESLVRSHQNLLLEPFFERTLSLDGKRSYSKSDPDVSMYITLLSDAFADEALHKIKDRYLASAFLHHALSLDELINPPDRRRLAERYEALGDIYLAQNQYSNAALVFKQVIVQKNQKRWVTDPELIIPYQKLSRTFVAMKKYTMAQTCLKQALSICNATHEPPVIRDSVLSELERLNHFVASENAPTKDRSIRQVLFED